MATKHERSRLESIADFFNDARYSDLTLKCRGESFHVHKVLVCAAAPSLAAAVRHGTKEAIDNIIEHEQYDAATLDRVLRYIYLQDYSAEDYNTQLTSAANNTASEQEGEPSPGTAQDQPTQISTLTEESCINKHLIAHVRVFGLADYFGMPILKTLAVEKFTAEGAGDARIDVTSFVKVIQEVHMCSAPSDDEMWNALKSVTYPRRHALASHRGFMKELVESTELQDFTATLFADLVCDLDAAKCQIDDSNNAHEKEIESLKYVIQTGMKFYCRSCGVRTGPSPYHPRIEKGPQDSQHRWRILCNICGRELERTS